MWLYSTTTILKFPIFKEIPNELFLKKFVEIWNFYFPAGGGSGQLFQSRLRESCMGTSMNNVTKNLRSFSLTSPISLVLPFSSSVEIPRIFSKNPHFPTHVIYERPL